MDATASPATDAASRVRTLVERAWEEQHAKPHESCAWAREALAQAESQGAAGAAAWARLTIGYYELRYGENTQARLTLQAAHEALERLGDRRGRILAANGLARVRMVDNDLAGALEAFRRNLADAGDALTTLDRFYTLNGIAGCLSRLGDTARALGYLFEALGELRSINARPQLATLLSNLGSELVAVGDLEEAHRVLVEAQALVAQLEHPRLRLTVMANLAECLVHLRRAAEALPAARQLMADPETAHLSSPEGNVYSIAALVFLENDAMAEARHAVELALDAARVHASHTGTVQALTMRGRLEAKQRQHAQAIATFDEARRLFVETTPQLTRCQVLDGLAEALAAAGRHAEAYGVQREFLAAYDHRLGLASRARYFAVQIRFELDRMRAERDKLLEQAVRDPLTGLHNRRYLDSVLGELLEQFGRSGEPIAVALIDLDHFKHINDRYGHPFGDEALRAFAQVLKAGTRGGDIVCRYGGEEFCLVLPHAGPEGAVARLEQLLAALGARVVTHAGRELSGITFSAGVAGFPADGVNAAEVVSAADRALYEAKRAGRGRVVRV